MEKKETPNSVLNDLHHYVNEFYTEWDDGRKTEKQVKNFLAFIKKKVKNF